MALVGFQKGGKMAEPRIDASLPPLEWGNGKVRLECVFLGKTQHFELTGPFARIGSDPRCEICIPGLPAPVCVYLQVSKTYIAVLELVESNPMSMCEPVFATQGGTFWLQPNARVTVQAIAAAESQIETFSWENFNVDDVRVSPNTLVARSGYLNSAPNSTHLRIQSALSILGTSPACQMQPKHKLLSRFQAILFRGEGQGDSCRVVDLFGEHQTLVDDKPAHGQVLEVGSVIRIATLSFEAARFLYKTSGANPNIEVGNQMTTLPYPRKTSTAVPLPSSAPNASDRQQLPLPGMPVIQTIKDRLVRAIGFDKAASRKPLVHFPTDQASPLACTGSVEGLDRVVDSQERLGDEFEKLSERIDSMGRAIESLPEIIDQRSHQLVEAIESLRDLLSQTPTNAAPERSSAPEPSAAPLPSQSRISEAPKPRPVVFEQKSKLSSKPQASSIKAQSAKNSKQKENSNQKSNQKPPTETARSPKPSAALGPTWMQRVATQLSTWIPNNAQRRRATAQSDDQSDPLDLASQSTAKRTRLRQIDNDSELLASNESQEETQVLGSLVGLRYRDARKARLRWLLFFGIISGLTIIGGPLVWHKIPEGWRELIWQKITFSETAQDPLSDLPAGDSADSPIVPTPATQPETERSTAPGGTDDQPADFLLDDPIFVPKQVQSGSEVQAIEPGPIEPGPIEPSDRNKTPDPLPNP